MLHTSRCAFRPLTLDPATPPSHPPVREAREPPCPYEDDRHSTSGETPTGNEGERRTSAARAPGCPPGVPSRQSTTTAAREPPTGMPDEAYPIGPTHPTTESGPPHSGALSEAPPSGTFFPHTGAPNKSSNPRRRPAVSIMVTTRTHRIPSQKAAQYKSDQSLSEETEGEDFRSSHAKMAANFTSQQPAPFVMKTYDMVMDPATDNIISWTADGTAFCVRS